MSESTPTMEVRARLTADASQFTQGMAQATQATQNFIGQANKSTAIARGVGIAFAAVAGSMIAFAEKSFMAAARVQELDVALQAVGKSTGLGYQALADTAKAVKSMGIEMNVAQRSTLMFAQNNLKLADASKLARVAQDLAVLSGKNSTEEFQLLTYAVMTQRSELFKSAGINGSVQGAYQKMAATLHESTKQLTAAQKVQAAMNMALEEGARVAGTYEAAMQTPSKVLRSFPRIFDDIMVGIGNALLKGFGPLIYHLYHMVSAFKDAVEGSGAVHNAIVALGNVIEALTTPITNAVIKIQDWITKMDTAQLNVYNMTQKIKGAIPVVTGLGTAFALFGAKDSFLTRLPAIGGFFAKLTGPIGMTIAVLLSLMATSSKVRSAVMDLVHSLAPLLSVLKVISVVINDVGQVFVAVLAVAIQKVADLITGLTQFFQDHKTIAEALGATLAILTASFYAESIALGVVSAAETVALWAMYAFDAAAKALTVTMGVLTSPVTWVIAVIVGLIAIFIMAWKHSETFRDVVTKAFNVVATIIGKVIGFVLDLFSDLLMAISHLLDVHDSLGKTIASVFNFIKSVVLTAVIFVVDLLKWLLQGIQHLTDPFHDLGKVVIAVFNFIGNVISTAVTFVIVTFATLIKGIATLLHWFGVAQDFIGEVFSKIGQAIEKAANWIGDVISKIANWIGDHLIDPIRDKLSDFFKWLSDLAKKVPIVGNLMGAGLKDLSAWLSTSKTPAGMTGPIGDIAVSADAATKAISALSSASNTLNSAKTTALDWAKSWGNYDTGISGVLSKVASQMLKIGTSVADFGAKFDVTSVFLDISKGAKVAADGLQSVADVLGNIKDADVGSALVSGLSDAAKTSALFVAGLSNKVQDFMSGDVLGKTGGAIGDVIKSLKDALGFTPSTIFTQDMTIAGQTQAPIGTPPAPPTTDPGVQSAAKIKMQADLMKKISEAMISGIDSIQKTIDAMAQAAQDFAKSLKDVVINFAGIKGVQLPDGFIPQAKSLIESMQNKLDKAKQFAMQIAELQAMGLDNSALKDIIDEGVVKGAQLAAAILGGGQEAVNQVSALQKQIQFTGSVIGGIGANAVYGQSIMDANKAYTKLTDAPFSTSGTSGGGVGQQIQIAQGAIQVTVDASGVKDEKLVAIMVGNAIQEKFALLAKSLAVK